MHTTRLLLLSSMASRQGVAKNNGDRFSVQYLLDLAKKTTTASSSSSSATTTTLSSLSKDEQVQVQQQQILQKQRIETGCFLLSRVEMRLQRQRTRLRRLARIVALGKDEDDFESSSSSTQHDNMDKAIKLEESSSSSIIRTSEFHTPIWRRQANQQQQQQQPPSSSSSSSLAKHTQQQQEEESRLKKKAVKELETLERIHADTAEACRTVLNTVDNADNLDTPSSPYQEKTLARHLVETATQIPSRHARSLESLAEIVVELRKTGTSSLLLTETDDGQNLEPKRVLRRSIMPFLQERLGIQLFCEHYVEMCKNKEKQKKKFSMANQQQQNDKAVINYGAFDKDRSVSDAVRDATGEAKILTEAYYDYIPNFEIVSSRIEGDEGHEVDKEDGAAPGDHEVHATFVGHWVHYVLVELLKNATTATMERHGEVVEKLNEDQDKGNHGINALPSIQIRIIQNTDWTRILVEDEGVGLRTTGCTKEVTTSRPFTLSSFRFGNTDKLWDRLDEQTTVSRINHPTTQLAPKPTTDTSVVVLVLCLLPDIKSMPWYVRRSEVWALDWR